VGRAHGLCYLCPPMPRRGHHRAHRDDAVQWCQACNGSVCTRHVRWDGGQDRWLCARCGRTEGASLPG